MQEEINLIYFNAELNSHPLSYKKDLAYKNLEKAALEAKEFLDYGLESKKKYKKLRKEALNVLDYFSKTVNKFYTRTLKQEQYNYLLENSPKKILKDIKSGKAIGLEQKLEVFDEF